MIIKRIENITSEERFKQRMAELKKEMDEWEPREMTEQEKEAFFKKMAEEAKADDNPLKNFTFGDASGGE